MRAIAGRTDILGARYGRLAAAARFGGDEELSRRIAVRVAA